MIEDILVPFITVGLAELGDKTQISVLLLSTRTKKHLQLLLGVLLAFLIVDGAAILAGSWVVSIAPKSTIKIIAGGIFIILGALIILHKKTEEGEDKSYSKNPFLSGLILILITEWGDKTQIAAGLFAMEYNPWMVLAGTMATLAVLSVMAIFLAKLLMNKIKTKIINKIAAAVFILIGILCVIINN